MPAGLFTSLFFTFAGLLIFIQVHNRLILLMKKGPVRKVITLLAVLILMVVPGIYGLFALSKGAVLTAGLLISICLITDIHLRFRRRSLRVRESVDEWSWHDPSSSGGLFHNTSEHLVIRRYSLAAGAWKAPAFRIAHISDLHVDTHASDHFFRRVFDALESLNPDILLVTGDFTDDIDELTRILPLFKNVSPARGTFAVLGNHDFWMDHVTLRKNLEFSGVCFPSIQGMTLDITPAQKLALYGVDYPHSKPWLLNSKHIDKSNFTVALSHSPDNVFRLAKAGIDVVFSGHLHGGQWRLPLIGGVVSPSIYDRLLDQGHFKIRDTHLFVTSGIGNVWIPRRINCPPEILVVDVKAFQESSHPGTQTGPGFPDLQE
jgi:predicted MPP superfamily phosphohydrolase